MKTRSAFILLLLVAATASPAAVSLPGAPGIRVILPDQVLQDHTQDLPTGELLFQDAGGARIRLITSTGDPEITNAGDGTFYPAEASIVMEALAQIPSEFLSARQVDIYLLPYPRSGMVSSSADEKAIYLTPGVRPYEARQIHFLVAHEIGHIVHRALLPDSRRPDWAEWAVMRGVSDSSVYFADAPHANRPHEVFAEDFRVLFGGSLARGEGAIENTGLIPPERVPGLRDYYLSLAGVLAADPFAAWTVFPNPARFEGSLTLRTPSGWDHRADRDLQAALFDISGRMVRDVRLQPAGPSQWALRLDDSGPSLPAGVYWLRVSGEHVPAGTATASIRIVN